MFDAAWKFATTVLVVGVAFCVAPCEAGPVARYDARAKAEYGVIFNQVLQRYIASKPGLNICLPPLFGFGDTVNDTVVVNPDLEVAVAPDGTAMGRAAQFKALEAAGLVSGVESTREVNGKTVRNVTYKRTAKGLAVSQGPSLCYARGELDHIVKWKGPVALGEYQAAFVYYTIKTAKVEAWVRAPELLDAFPTVKASLKENEPKVRQVVIDLSSEGWDIAEYSKYLQLQ